MFGGIYRTAGALGFAGQLDGMPLHVVRWSMSPDEETQGESPADMARLAMERGTR